MCAAFTEEWLAGIGADRNGRREFPRNPVAGGGVDGVERGGEGVDGPVDLPREATEPNLGRACAAVRRPLAAGGNGSRPVKSRQAGGSPAPSNKYGAVRTEGLGPNGERRIYDSRKEERTARELNAEMSAGLIVSWVPQVSMPCGVAENGRDVRYRADALAILQVNADGTFVGRFVDVKGRDTPASRAKRAALRQLHQIDVKVIT